MRPVFPVNNNFGRGAVYSGGSRVTPTLQLLKSIEIHPACPHLTGEERRLLMSMGWNPEDGDEEEGLEDCFS